MMLNHKPIAVLCLAGVALFGMSACGGSKTNSGGGNANPTTTVDGATLPTVPPPAKVTGTLSGPGVTASTITLGQITTITGPVPGLFQGANDGLDAWAAWVNDNGGIDGRQVKIDHVDDAFNCTTYTNAMKQFATSAFAVVGNLTLEDTCGKSVLAANPKLIDVQALALDPTLYSVPNVYTAVPAPPGGGTTGLEFMKQKFPGAVLKAGQLVGQAAAANGKEELLTAESVGYHYLYVQDVPDLTTNFTSYILKMKSEGVQYVDMTALAVTSDADFLQQAAQQNYHPQVLYSGTAYDAQFFKLLGKASLANNVVWSALPFALYLGQDRATNPAVNTFLDYLPKARANATPDQFAVDSWTAGELLLQAMTTAGSTISPTSVLSALSKVTDFNADGMIGSTHPGTKGGTTCVVMANVQNGQWIRVHPTGTGFDCSGTYHNVPLSSLNS